MKADYDFRAQFYDLEFTDSSDRRLISTLISEDVNTILEVPCGSGRNIWLAETGKAVCFADLSQRMVWQVQQKLNEMGIGTSKAIMADMTELGVGRFDLIIIAREGIQLLSRVQIRQAFKALSESLTKNGRLYVDFAKLDGRHAGPSDLPGYIKTRGEAFTPDIEFSYQGKKVKRFHKSQLKGDDLYIDFRYVLQGREPSYTVKLVLANYALDEIRHIASECGLVMYDLFGGYDGKPYTDESERFIIIFKRDEQ